MKRRGERDLRSKLTRSEALFVFVLAVFVSFITLGLLLDNFSDPNLSPRSRIGSNSFGSLASGTLGGGTSVPAGPHTGISPQPKNFLIGVGAYNYNSTGRVYLYDDAGTLLGNITGPNYNTGNNRFGYRVALLDDVNGDNIDDLAVSSPFHWISSNGRVQLLSGADGTQIWSRVGENGYDYFGTSISSVGDFNNDGIADLIVGSYGYDGANFTNSIGKAYVLSGNNGTIIWSQEGEATGSRFGQVVSSVGDINNDGYDDVAVWAISYSAYLGKIYIYSGINGAELWSKVGPNPFDGFGVSFSSVNDINGDGYNEVVVGSSGYGSSDSGKVYLLSGINGAELWSKVGGSGDRFGISMSRVDDLDNDGYNEIAVGSYGHLSETGKVSLLSGINGAELWNVVGVNTSSRFGYSVSSTKDANEDGVKDIVVGAYRTTGPDGFYQGRMRVISGVDGSEIWSKIGEEAGTNFGFSVSG